MQRVRVLFVVSDDLNTFLFYLIKLSVTLLPFCFGKIFQYRLFSIFNRCPKLSDCFDACFGLYKVIGQVFKDKTTLQKGLKIVFNLTVSNAKLFFYHTDYPF